MRLTLTHPYIKSLCGEDNYIRGLSYLREGKVSMLRRSRMPERYECEVRVSRPCTVQIEFHETGSVRAECTCLAFEPLPPYCKHTAAALLLIGGEESGGESTFYSEPRLRSEAPFPSQQAAASGRPQVPAGKSYLRGSTGREAVEDMLELFLEQPGRRSGTGMLTDDRERLDVQFALQFIPHGHGRHMIGIELRIGAQRSYIVHKIADFLQHVEDGKSFPFTKLFHYDPGLHCFGAEDDAVLKQLCGIRREERRFKETVLRNKLLPSRGPESDRMMAIPPFAWDELLTLLLSVRHVTVEVYSGGRRKHDRPLLFDGLQLCEEERPPLRFTLDRGTERDGEYAFTAYGMRKLIVLEGYGAAFAEGRLYRLPPRRLEQLGKLKALLESAAGFDEQPELTLGIDSMQIEGFMERVVPGLSKLGEVELSETVSLNILYKPLKARMYLDRIRGRLLAGLEFQYGDIVINPLEASGMGRGTDRIVMRDGEKERRILALLEHDNYLQTEGGYIIEGDDAEYEFLCKLVPELEKELNVYATSAVKLRIADNVIPPKISIAWDERTDWLDFQFQLDGISDKEIRSIVQAVQEKRRYYKLANGSLLPLETGAFEALLRVMNGVGLHHPTLFDDTVRVPVGRALSLLDVPLAEGTVRIGRSLRELLDNMRHPEQLDFPLPAGIEHVLRDYQKHGFQWMKTLAHYRFGGILADEMGLGKTVQSIAFLLSVLPAIRKSGRPSLIVSPASLIYNWRSELARFAPGLRVVVADGAKAERGTVLAESARRAARGDGNDPDGEAAGTAAYRVAPRKLSGEAANGNPYGEVLATETDGLPGGEAPVSAADGLLDGEVLAAGADDFSGGRIHGEAADRFSGDRSFAAVADGFSAGGGGTNALPDVIITSYPLLRRDVDQYAAQYFHTLILDEAQAFKNYATQTAQAVRALKAEHRFALTGTPIENRLEELWSIFSVVFPELFPGRREFGELSREAVAKRSRPFLLRRLKSDVLRELPEKIETLQPSALLPEQKKLYAAYLAKLRQDSLKHLDSDDFGRARIKILAGITRLRQLCCHPALFVEDYKGSSAKFEQLLELIDECRGAGRRMLIFSQFTSMLGLIGRELGYEGVPYFYLDGSTPVKERVELCHRFNEGERDLFLLSLKAGGTGLNLTGADTVILYDLWWNPAVEQQAADRAHRIGQRNVVQIIRLVAEGTVEEKMYELQQRKRSLIDEVIEPGNEALSSLTEQELRELLAL